MIPNVYPIAFVEPGKEPEGARTVTDPVVIDFARRMFADFQRLIRCSYVYVTCVCRGGPPFPEPLYPGPPLEK